MKSVNDLIAVQEGLKTRQVNESVQAPEHQTDGQVQVQMGMNLIKRMSESAKEAKPESTALYGKTQFPVIGV